MSDRIFGVLWLLAMAGMAWVAWQIEAPYSYEPIGPKAYPLLLCGLMAACAAWLLVKPDPQADWPRERALQVKVAIMLVALFAWAVLLEPLGFIASTALASIAIGYLFDARWGPNLVAGLVSGIGLYLFFDKALDVVLPLGRLWGF
jgi:putative tricarboxylic transport membrane protein